MLQIVQHDHLVVDYLEHRLLDPNRVQDMLAAHLDRREERDKPRRTSAAEAVQRLKRLYDAIKSGFADINDPSLKEHIEGLKATRDQARVDAERARAAIKTAGQSLTLTRLERFASRRPTQDAWKARRTSARPSAWRCPALLKTLVAADAQSAAGGVPTLETKWRAILDEDDD